MISERDIRTTWNKGAIEGIRTRVLRELNPVYQLITMAVGTKKFGELVKAYDERRAEMTSELERVYLAK